MTLQSPEFEAMSLGADMHPHLRGQNENKTKARRVQAPYFKDMHNMTVTEVYEDKDYGEVARVEFSAVTTITPQVATEFIYDPNPN